MDLSAINMEIGSNMSIPELALVVGIISTIISGAFTAYQANLAKIQRRRDYLRDEQKNLRKEKAEFDAWKPVYDKKSKDNPEPMRHGIYTSSMAQSIMFAINDAELDNLAKQLDLYPDTLDKITSNQKVLEQATARFAKLLDENSPLTDFQEQH